MPTNYPCPRPGALEEVLHAMVGAEVKVALDKKATIDDDAPAILAEFVSDSEDVGVLCVVDHAAALSLGGALVGVAPEAAQQAIEGYKLDDEAIENVREVVNVMAQLFNTDCTPHVRFKELHRQPGKLPEPAHDLLRKPRATRHYRVSVDKYSAGLVTFLLG
jgi:hypothetical protein